MDVSEGHVIMQILPQETLTSLQLAVKEQLLKRAIPSYVPRPTPSQEYRLDQFFCCKDCDDRFILEASLIRHIERRSVAITYRCRSCDKVLLFYNRCALLAHLRSHSIAEYDSDEEEAEEDIVLSSDAVKGEEVSSNVDVEPDSLAMCSLPKEKYLLGPLDDLPMDKDGRLIRKRKKAKRIKTSCANTQVTDYHIDQCMAEVNSALMLGILQSPKSNHINLEIIKTKEKEAADVEIAAKIKDKNHPSATSEDYFVFTSHLRTDASLDKATELSVCRECGVVPANNDMKEHFLGSNTPQMIQFKCKTCNLISPTKCSLQAHNRIHTQTKPFICPECLREFELWATFSVHLVYTCFHLAKGVKYRCLQCKGLFPTSVSLEAHLLQDHVKNVFKCLACPVACFSLQALQDHRLNTHRDTTSKTHSSYMQCQLCPDRLIPKSRILYHVNEHSRDFLVRIYVYQCGDCDFFAQKKTDFAVHKTACTKAKSTISTISPSPSIQKTSQIVASTVVSNSNSNFSQQKNQVPLESILNKNINPQQKFLISVDNIQSPNNVNNCVKLVYNASQIQKQMQTQSQKQMQLSIVPKSYLKTFKKVILTNPKERTILPKFTVEQVSLRDNQGTLSGGNNNENAGEIKIAAIDQQDGGKKYVCVSEKKCETNADEAQELLSNLLGNHKVINKNSKNTEACIKNVPATLKPGTFLRLCALCKNEYVIVPPSLGKSNFQALCVYCSKSHTFSKTDNKVIIVSKETQSNGEDPDSITTNGTIKLMSHSQDKNAVVHNKNTLKFNNTNSTELNGLPEPKKLKTSDSDLVSNFYRCHLCKNLVSMDCKNVQAHYSEFHPNLKMLPLSPKVDKLDFPSGKMPFIVKDNKIYSKHEESSYNEHHDIDSNDETGDHEDYNNENDQKDSDNSDEESIENDRSEEFHYVRRGRDLPIDYDLIPSKMKKKRKSHKDKEIPITPFSSGQIVPPLEKIGSSDGSYKCAKCEYSDKNSETFHSHIIQHRTDENAIQCMECGQCFVVKPSFAKHLFISHRIKDMEAYLEQNNCYNSSNSDKFEEITIECTPQEEKMPEDLLENQCRVCKEIFETQFELNKHFRTHGMAFLLMKKKGM